MAQVNATCDSDAHTALEQTNQGLTVNPSTEVYMQDKSTGLLFQCPLLLVTSCRAAHVTSKPTHQIIRDAARSLYSLCSSTADSI